MSDGGGGWVPGDEFTAGELARMIGALDRSLREGMKEIKADFREDLQRIDNRFDTLHVVSAELYAADKMASDRRHDDFKAEIIATLTESKADRAELWRNVDMNRDRIETLNRRVAGIAALGAPVLALAGVVGHLIR